MSGILARMMRFVSCLFLLLFACGEDRPSVDASVDQDLADANPDADGAVSDGGGEFETAFTQCSNLMTSSSFEIAPAFRRGQLQPHASFDGEKVWVTFSAVEENTSKFDIFYAYVACDNSIAEPVLVNTTIEPNDVQPKIAISSDAALIAWQSDMGGIQTRFRSFDLQGAPLVDTDTLLSSDGATTHWHPNPIITENAFALVGSRGVENTLESYLLPISRTGELGTLVSPFESEAGQQTPAALWRDGSYEFIWTAFSNNNGNERQDAIHFTDGDSSSTALNPAGPAKVGSIVEGRGTSYVAISESTERRNISVIDTVSGESASVGDPMKLDVAPSMAMWSFDTGVVTWIENSGGLRNEILAARFGFAGGGVTAGPTRTIRTSKTVPPFAPSIVHIQEHIYFIVWAEGDNPEFRVTGQFVDFR